MPRARVWVTPRTRARAPHARQILRSRDESIGEINLMASYLATESETADAGLKFNFAGVSDIQYLTNCYRSMFRGSIITREFAIFNIRE